MQFIVRTPFVPHILFVLVNFDREAFTHAVPLTPSIYGRNPTTHPLSGSHAKNLTTVRIFYVDFATSIPVQYGPVFRMERLYRTGLKPPYWVIYPKPNGSTQTMIRVQSSLAKKSS